MLCSYLCLVLGHAVFNEVTGKPYKFFYRAGDVRSIKILSYDYLSSDGAHRVQVFAASFI